MIPIYIRGTSQVRTYIDPDANSQQERNIMGQDTLTLNCSVPDPIFFEVGDYANLFSMLYTLNLPYTYKAVADRNIQYTLVMESTTYQLQKTAFLFLDASNRFTEGKFNQLGKPVDFMLVIIANLNRNFPGAGWQLGDVIDADYQSIDFDSQNCLEALQTLATTFQTEYYIEGKVVSLAQKQGNSGIILSYGKGNALYSISRTNQDSTGDNNTITRLYAYGSNRNIGSNYRDGAKYLRMANSLYVERNIGTDPVEATVYFDDIYPRREGTISAIASELIFTDADIDFNVNDYLLPGVTAQVTFNTGLLVGYTFDISGFDNDTKTFTINKSTGDQTVDLPSDDLKPAIGDKYVLINITMPLSYVNNAETELLLRAQDYIKKNGPEKLTYAVDCNPLYFKREGITPVLGFTYQLQSQRLNLDISIRLAGFTRNVRKPDLYTFTLADTVPVQPLIVKILNSL